MVDPTDSDPTWPEPIENPAIAGTALAGANRAERFKRFVRTITIRVHRAGPTLAVTLELCRDPAQRAELPLELGLTLVVPRTTFNGTPDVFAKLEEVGESVMCSVPARGLHAGDKALFVVSHGDTYEQVETVVS